MYIYNIEIFVVLNKLFQYRINDVKIRGNNIRRNKIRR